MLATVPMINRKKLTGLILLAPLAIGGVGVLAGIEGCTITTTDPALTPDGPKGGNYGVQPNGPPGTDPYGTDPYGTDPYDTDPYGTDPYGQSQ